MSQPLRHAEIGLITPVIRREQEKGQITGWQCFPRPRDMGCQNRGWKRLRRMCCEKKHSTGSLWGTYFGVSVSDPMYWCRAVWLHCTGATQTREVCSPLSLAWVAIAMPDSEPVWVARAARITAVPTGVEEFVFQCFIVLPEDASAGLHSDAPALCSHRHCFLGPPISF